MTKASIIQVMALLAANLPATAQPESVRAVQEFANRNEASILQSYRKFLTIPHVASDLPNKPDVPPVVYGELRVPGAKRTIVL